MKDIGICTYCTWTSYGSMLQAYAFKQFLKKEFNAESAIVCSDHSSIEKKTIKPYGSLLQRLKLIAIELLSHRKGRDAVFNKNKDFLNKYIDFVFYNNYESLRNQPPRYDLFIAGSDQIFHPDLCNPLFFLDFISDDKIRKISYAASMGKTYVRPEKERTFSRLLQNFNALSVREKDNVSVIERYNAKHIDVHIDPTFLLDIKDWRKIEKPYPVKGKYYLVYPLFWDKKCNKQIRELKRKTGCKIYTVSNGFTKAYGKKLYNVGIQEFLWLIDNAQGIITSSFHGVALSAIFNKEVSAIINPQAPSRINCLKEFLGLKTVSIDEITTDHIDYQEVNKRIVEERKRSFAYLKKHIENE